MGMYCRGCEYDLSQVADARVCPECGCPFDVGDPSSFLPTLNPSMYCRGCKYDLSQLGDARVCPECGRSFNPEEPRSFLQTPALLSQKWTRNVALIGIAILIALYIQFMAAAQSSGH